MVSLLSLFDPSALAGQRRTLQLTIGLLLTALLIQTVYVYLLSHTWVLHWREIVALLLLLALGQWPRLSLMGWGLVCLAAFVVAAFGDITRALNANTLPTGMSLWTPLILLESFVVLGSAYGVVVVSVVVVVLMLAFALSAPLEATLLGAWIQLMFSCAAFSVVGYGFSRFLQQSDQHIATTAQALSRARLDALTRVLGRAAIEYELELSCERAAEQKIALSLIVCDIDHFKKVNDQHGHAKGDDVLRAVAQKLRHNTATIGAKVGRWGGEEFVILVPRYARNEAITLAEQIRKEIANNPMAGLNITLSLGVASYRRGETYESLFERADQATYRAKAAGRNRVETAGG